MFSISSILAGMSGIVTGFSLDLLDIRGGGGGQVQGDSVNGGGGEPHEGDIDIMGVPNFDRLHVCHNLNILLLLLLLLLCY